MANTLPVIVPKPIDIKVNNGEFILKDGLSIYYDSKLDLTNVKSFINTYVTRSTGFHFKEEKDKSHSNLVFLANDSLGKEEYNLELTPERLTVEGSTVSGHFYGLQTFIQLFPTEIFSEKHVTNVSWNAPCVTVHDKPRFLWRGVHLDGCRHFQTVEEIHKFLYRMAVHKLNVFHWHLTDDQGWRFESKKYPKLTEIACKRIEKDGTQYGPFFYSQEEMREIVSFAKSLCIKVVPEIEMPGHSCAVIAAYPEFGCLDKDGKPSEGVLVENNWGIFEPVLCLSNPNTIQFLKDILIETIDVFYGHNSSHDIVDPIHYIHIGGDEVLTANWEHCPRCQKLWKEHNIENGVKYQGWLNLQIQEFLSEHQITMIGWNEIVECGLPTEKTIIMAWESFKSGTYAANKGYKVIMTPMECFYLDHCQFEDHSDEKKYLYIGGMATMHQVYDLNPTHTIEIPEKIIGCQCNVWTERMFSYKDVEWKIFPRLCALSEVSWTPNEKKDYAQFENGINKIHLKRLKEMDINYAVHE